MADATRSRQHVRQQAKAHALAYGLDEATIEAILDAYERAGQTLGRSFDPSGWSRTVWYAERDRWQRWGSNPERHYDLILKLDHLRDGFERKVERGKRGFVAGRTGERLSPR